MKLSQFYQFLNGHTSITLKKGDNVAFNGYLNSVPDEYDELTVIDFKGTGMGFVFFVE